MRGTIATLLGLCLAAGAGQGADHTKDSPETVKKKVADKKAVLVDVREKSEWDEGHLRDAKLLPLSDLKGKIDAKKLEKTLPKDRIIYLHCRAGSRCLTAADVLGKLGYDVRPLKEGYADLVKAGFPKAEK